MNTTKKFLAAWLVVAFLYEGWTLVNKDEQDTISETIWEWKKNSLFTLVVGFICGHWFFDRVSTAKREKEESKGAS